MTKLHSPPASGESLTPSIHRHGQGSNKLYVLLIAIFSFSSITFFMTHTSNHRVSSKHTATNHENHPMLKEFMGKKTNDESINIIISNSSSSNTIVANKHSSTTTNYHVVFSTSCDDQQFWESYVFFFHANKVRQPGTVTRIASGCNDEEGKMLQQFHNTHIRDKLSNNFHLHLTPDFAKVPAKRPDGTKVGGDKMMRYKYMNKPFGLLHWMENVLRKNETARNDDDIVILMDPDMILLRPIVHDYTNENVIFVEENPKSKIVSHGHPMAQQDGYLSNQWMGLNATYITGREIPSSVNPRAGPTHYNTGPPYLATVRDMYRIAKLWVEYAPRVHDVYPKLFAEMYGFIYATVTLSLPHTLIKSLVVSVTETKNREGWQYVDGLPEAEVCRNPSPTIYKLPVGLHYCKRYLLGRWFFSKYRLKKKYISCDAPLLTPPPADLATKNIGYWEQPPPHGHQGVWEAPSGNISQKQAKREAFMLCGLISAINEAATYFKQTSCNGTANLEANYNFFDDPHH